MGESHGTNKELRPSYYVCVCECICMCVYVCVCVFILLLLIIPSYTLCIQDSCTAQHDCAKYWLLAVRARLQAVISCTYPLQVTIRSTHAITIEAIVHTTQAIMSCAEEVVIRFKKGSIF